MYRKASRKSQKLPPLYRVADSLPMVPSFLKCNTSNCSKPKVFLFRVNSFSDVLCAESKKVVTKLFPQYKVADSLLAAFSPFTYSCPAEYIKMPRPRLIFSHSDYLIWIVAINSHT